VPLLKESLQDPSQLLSPNPSPPGIAQLLFPAIDGVEAPLCHGRGFLLHLQETDQRDAAGLGALQSHHPLGESMRTTVLTDAALW
jgi:hypothetical protein